MSTKKEKFIERFEDEGIKYFTITKVGGEKPSNPSSEKKKNNIVFEPRK